MLQRFPLWPGYMSTKPADPTVLGDGHHIWHLGLREAFISQGPPRSPTLGWSEGEVKGQESRE